MSGEEPGLREGLHRLADATAPPPRADLAGTIAGRHRARRRRHAALAAVAVVVAGVVVVVPGLLRGPGPAPTATPATGAGEPAIGTDTPATVATADVYAAPTRGSLAGDAAFVDGVRQLPWTSGDGAGVPDPPPAERHVVFAGDVPGGRWALVAGRNAVVPAVEAPELQTDLGPPGDVAIAWFVGPPGATPAQMELQSAPYGTDPWSPAALSDTATGALVVVAAPGDAIEVSLRPEIAADGTASRSWTAVAAPGGVAVLDVGRRDATVDQALRYRVTRAGQTVVRSPDGYADPARTAPEVEPGWLREPPPSAPADELVDAEVADVLSRTGLPAAEVRFGVLWAGDVSAADGRTGRVTLLTATLPSGAVYVSALAGVAFADGSRGGTVCGSAVLPGSTSLPEATVAVRCHLPTADGVPAGPGTLVVVGPERAVTAALLATGGQPLGEVALVGGIAVTSAPERVAEVRTRDAEGRTVDRVRLLGVAELEG
ncbi:hypothetical protein ACI78V_19375 [Geodermatophilus sp. SYSU D00742]